MMEEWKPAFGYESRYSVSNMGSIRRNTHWRNTYIGRILKQSTNSSRYAYVRIQTGSHKKNVKIHRLVAASFIGECPIGMEVNHIDGNRNNNTLSNLEYITKSENIRHAFKLGLRNLSHGESHWITTLRLEEVKNIKKEYLPGNGEKLAKKYNVTRQTIYNIINNITWKVGV